MRSMAWAVAALTLSCALAPGLHAQSGERGEGKPPTPPCTPRSGRAVVVGSVVDSSTAIPLEGAGVVLKNADGRGGFRDEKEGETDRAGRFRLCDALAGGKGLIQINFWGTHVERPFTLTDTVSEPLDLVLDAPHSLLQGRVLDAANQAVEGASVRLAGVPNAQITDPEGAFTFGRVPPGSYEVRVEHLAFTTVVDTMEVDFASGVDATIHVAPGVIALEPITVVVRSIVLERKGFYDRQKTGHGAFITRQMIEAQHYQEGAQILARVAGLKVQARSLGDATVALARAGCPVRYIVDGARTAGSYSIDYVGVGDIEGLEIYLGPAQVPAEFGLFPGETGGSCGLIVVWTRQNVKL